MNPVYEKIQSCFQSLSRQADFHPRAAIVLGSGLGDFAKQIRIEHIVDYQKIEGFPISTVAGHEGKFIFGKLENVPVVCMQGRIHYYEGYEISDVVLPIRLMHLMGARILFLTNAAGGMGSGFEPGDLMLIEDQIACFVPSPLRGENIGQLGGRFPDMSEIYDLKLRKMIADTAKELQIPLRQGIYVQMPGPQYETPAEVRMCRMLGAGAVGMSTAVEAIAAVHAGMKVAGISCITNLAAGMSEQKLSHEEVRERALEAEPKFRHLLSEAVRRAGGMDL